MNRIITLLLLTATFLTVTSCKYTIVKTDDASSTESISSQIDESSSEEDSSSDVVSSEIVESSEVSSLADESKSAASDDIKGAIEASATSDTNAANIGQWVKTARYSATDNTYHTVYVRVVSVKTESDDVDYINKTIKENNDNNEYRQIDRKELKVPSDCELAIMEYEVYVPSDYPTQDWGITKPDMSFTAGNIGGGGIPSADGTSTYIGLGSLMDLTTEESANSDFKYQVGNTYRFKELFEMVKGYKDYVFHASTYPEGTKETSGVEALNEYHSSK